ncbi:Unconventional myosin-XV-like protein, partial [Dinothrombium tinctorium]
VQQSTITFGTNNANENTNVAESYSFNGVQQANQNINANMPFTNIAGMTVPMVDTSQIIQQQLVHQQMIQRAFLASAVQQNLQIQQQLLQQNQALQQLLQTAVSPNSPPISNEHNAINNSPSLPILSPILEPLSLLQTIPLDSAAFASPSTNLLSTVSPSCAKTPDPANEKKNNTFSPNDSKTETNTKEVISILSGSKAKTVRIGKWRWPPPREGANSNSANSFLEFKMKKQQEKTDKNGDFDNKCDEQSSAQIVDAQKNEESRKEQKSHDRQKGEKVNRSFATHEKAKESIGKLRISSEMKAKLEQLTIDQSVRSKKDGREKLVRSMEDIREDGIKKLSEHRKALLEKQLMGSMKTLSEVGTRSSRDTIDFSVETETKVLQSNKQEMDRIDNFMKFSERFSVTRRSGSGSREIRERNDELGPHNRSGTVTSTVQAECGDHLSHSVVGTTLFDQMSVRNSLAYEESVSSSTSPMKMIRDPEPYNTKPIKRMSVPPPPPPTDHLQTNSVMNPGFQYSRQGPPSVAASSSYCASNTPIVVRRKEPPPSSVNFKVALDRLSLDRLEFMESSDFLNPIDAPPPTVVHKRDQQMLEAVKTKLFPPNSCYYLTYNKVNWRFRVRKEIFLPSEKIESPLMLHLVFCQIVKDVYSSNCIRLTREEKKKFQRQLQNYGITTENVNSSIHKLPVQRNIVEFAKEFPTYFCRLYPVSGGRNLPNVSLLGVSHSGIRLIQRERDVACDYLRVLDTLRFQDVAEVAIPRNCTLQLLLRTGGWLTLYTYKATHIRHLIERFIFDDNKAEAEFVKAVSDHVAVEPSLLNFSKGSIIRLVKNKNLHLAKGWLYGILESGESGIFPSEYVISLSKDEMIKLKHKMDEIKRSLKNGCGVQDGETRSVTHQTQQNLATRSPDMFEESSLWIESKVEQLDDSKSDVTHNSNLNDGKHSLLQFALFNFKEAIEKTKTARSMEQLSLLKA